MMVEGEQRVDVDLRIQTREHVPGLGSENVVAPLREIPAVTQLDGDPQRERDRDDVGYRLPNAFDAGDHDVYFLDYFLEDRTGLDLLKQARDRGITAPIILLTGRGSRAVDMEAMELGASDYLVKGLIDPDAPSQA